MNTEMVITGTGVAVTGLTRADELLGPRRGQGFDPATDLGGRHMRNKDRCSRLALYAAESALREADPQDDGGPVAVVVSTALGVLADTCANLDRLADGGATALSPVALPATSAAVVAGSVAIRFGLRGPNLTVTAGITGGLDAVYWASSLIAARRARYVVVAGVEAASAPAAKLLGEPVADAAAALVVEAAGTAAASGRRPLARIGRYARRDSAAEAEAAVLDGTAPALRLTGTEPACLHAAGRRDGALGVLACAAAASHLTTHGPAPVLIRLGGEDGNPAAALLLYPPS